MSNFDVINQTINGGTSGTPGAVLTANYTVTLNDTILEWSATGGAFNVVMPAASAALAGKVWILVQTTSSTNQVTVKTAGGTINGAAAGTGVAQTASKIGMGLVVCDGTNYYMSAIA
jgi:hypothetical protein